MLHKILNELNFYIPKKASCNHITFVNPTARLHVYNNKSFVFGALLEFL